MTYAYVVNNFRASIPNREILLAEDQVTVKFFDTSVSTPGKVYLRLRPKPQIEIRVRVDGFPWQDLLLDPRAKGEGSVRLKSRGLEMKVIDTNLKWMLDSNSTEITLIPKRIPIISRGADDTRIHSGTCCIFNFLQIGLNEYEKYTISENNYVNRQYIKFYDDMWHIRLSSMPYTNDTIRSLKEDGGFGNTHVIEFVRSDHNCFTGRDAYELITALRFFLTFAKGAWCAPVWAGGFNRSSPQPCWEFWSTPRDPWHFSSSWFNCHLSDQLANLFPGFMKKWNQQYWRDTLRECISLYVTANRSSEVGAEGIILTQAALERLSFEFLVRSSQVSDCGNHLSEKDFKKLSASCKLRKLFSNLNIPTEIPEHTPVLKDFAADNKWVDAVHTLTQIRNSLVHPERKHENISAKAYFEAWDLGLWYLEMSILAICGYSGKYSNRLKRPRWGGEVEDVPWKK